MEPVILRQPEDWKKDVLNYLLPDFLKLPKHLSPCYACNHGVFLKKMWLNAKAIKNKVKESYMVVLNFLIFAVDTGTLKEAACLPGEVSEYL